MAKFRPEDLPTGLESRESHLEFISYSLHIRDQQTPPEAYEELKREL